MGWHSLLKRVKKRLGLYVEALSIPCPNNNVQIVRKPRRAAGTENLRAADGRPMVTTLPNDVFLPFAPDKPWLAPLPTMLVHAGMVGAMLSAVLMPASEFWKGLAVFGAEVGAGEAVVLYILGIPLYQFIRKTKLIDKLLGRG